MLVIVPPDTVEEDVVVRIGFDGASPVASNTRVHTVVRRSSWRGTILWRA